jgi:hypothetical protein
MAAVERAQLVVIVVQALVVLAALGLTGNL